MKNTAEAAAAGRRTMRRGVVLNYNFRKAAELFPTSNRAGYVLIFMAFNFKCHWSGGGVGARRFGGNHCGRLTGRRKKNREEGGSRNKII